MAIKSTQFTPVRHGFHFSNAFSDKTFSKAYPGLNIPGLPPFSGGTKTINLSGRCAGMSSVALDYYWQQTSIPTHTKDDFGSGKSVPDLTSGLGKYIDDRHTAANGPDPACDAKEARIILLPREDLLGLPDPFNNLRRPVLAKGAYNFTLDELNDIRSQIDQGNPVLLGLVADQTFGALTGSNHAVVAYAYDDSNHDLYVYDCNFPDKECCIRANDGDRRFDTHSIEGGVWTKQYSWKGYVRRNHARTTPTYHDLTLVQSIGCKDADGNPVTWIETGKSVRAEYKIANKGQYTARLRYYYFSVLRVNALGEDNGLNEDSRLGALDTDLNANNDITLSPGQEYLVAKSSTVFNDEGIYRLGASFQTKQRAWSWGLHAVAGAATKAYLTVLRINFTWVAAALTPDGRVELFGRGSNNGIYHKWQQTGSGWHSPESLGGIILDDAISAANFSDGRLLVTHRGTDGRLYQRILSASGWDGGWSNLGGSLAGRPIILVTRPQGKLRIIAHFTDGTLQYRDEGPGGTWTLWAPL